MERNYLLTRVRLVILSVISILTAGCHTHNIPHRPTIYVREFNPMNIPEFIIINDMPNIMNINFTIIDEILIGEWFQNADTITYIPKTSVGIWADANGFFVNPITEKSPEIVKHKRIFLVKKDKIIDIINNTAPTSYLLVK